MDQERTQAGVIYHLKNYQLLQPHEIEKFYSRGVDNGIKYNLYFVLKRPKILINSSYFRINSNKIELEFLIKDKNSTISDKIFLELDEPIYRVHILTNELRNEMVIIYNNMKELLCKVSVLYDEIHRKGKIKNHHLDLKIEYIGQVKNDSKNDGIEKRLKRHEVLQRITDDTLRNDPDKEVWIFLCMFKGQYHILSGGKIRYDRNRASAYTDPEIMNLLFKQKKNIIEGALINYFKPPYNTQFKNKFPSNTHKSYINFKLLDINSVHFELDTVEYFKSLYSDCVKPDLDHRILCKLHDSKTRADLWNIDNMSTEHFVNNYDKFY